MKNVFIIGSKGIPANYGGYETFVENLTKYKNDKSINYHVACLSNNNSEFTHNNARCFNVKVPNFGAAKAVLYDILALKQSIKYIKNNNIQDAIIYILACRIGPFMWYYKRKMKKMNIKLFVNPDGHEWLRSKWNKLIRQYWKISEKLMVKHADLLICDSVNIEKYIRETYSKYKPNTTYIAYGADVKKSELSDDDSKFTDWLDRNKLESNKYYLIVGRFVPENNYETMIREFMLSKTAKNLSIITGSNDKFLNELKQNTNFESDSRIKFVGTVYDQELLKKIRENAYGYLHGHEVGGTNPSLLEALASTKLNLLFDVGFNKEVGKDAALYWNKEVGNLSELINSCDSLDVKDINNYSSLSKKIIKDFYTNDYINQKYEELFDNE